MQSPQDDEPEQQRQKLRRPDRPVVEFEQTVIGAGRKQQEIGWRVGPASPPSEVLDISDHAGPHRRIRQAPGGRRHVLAHMLHPGGCRNGAGHSRV